VALTYELAARGTPVREFFESFFPRERFKDTSRAWYGAVRAAPIVCAPPAGVNAGTTGTAFDYRARLCWSPIDWRTSVAAAGTENVLALGRVDLAALAVDLGEELAVIAPGPCKDDLADDHEERLNRCCYALALYEQFFRSAAATRSPLLEMRSTATLDDLLSIAPRPAIDDMSAMTRPLCSRERAILQRSAVLNPTFDGSAEIGGADADLIVDGTLIELKTTKQESFERVNHLFQLLGYALLDYSDRYRIERVGVYLARRGLLIDWHIDELLLACCTMTNWLELQRAFRVAARAENGGC
jgi:hypothetical protein